MSARDDYPYRERNVPMYVSDRTLHNAMCDEIDRLRNLVDVFETDGLILRDEIKRLQDAAHELWGLLPVDECKVLQDEAPRLVEFLRHLHHKIGHEEAMVRVNVWAEP